MKHNYEILSQESSPLIAAAIGLLFEQYPGSFHGYSAALLKRRISHFMSEQSITTLNEFQHRVISAPGFQIRLMQAVTVNYTEMFRDPLFFQALRKTALPYLSTYSTIKIWHAGCSTGEEVYSLAILLHELNLLHKTQIYATDINASALAKAVTGTYTREEESVTFEKYSIAGGQNKLHDYYSKSRNKITFQDFLKRQIIFREHDLIMDPPFDQFHLILCRNVLFYFDPSIQTRTCTLLQKSLLHLGYLAFGTGEKMDFLCHPNELTVIDSKEKIYRKVSKSFIFCKNDEDKK